MPHCPPHLQRANHEPSKDQQDSRYQAMAFADDTTSRMGSLIGSR